ncbi:neurotrypsin isoform X1 [Desmodus rotundus]|uniref:neurotrypsin isoform X1 n=1 Tax=Desmodus rotundus TaxID=9430 RepID=UPI0023816E5B|nr:neurotrypsin isoform X1 [Desmodus rotundus]
MMPVRLVVALILGALPEVVSADLVLGYPLHYRHRHPPPAAPHFSYHLSTLQWPPRTTPSLLARAPRPWPAPGAQRPLPLHAGHASRPHPGDCPAGGPWVNVTDFGAPCLRWADVPPLLERLPPEGWAPLRGQRHNFCRSPEGAGQPWCFYRNARGRGDWGYCDCGHGSVRLRGGLGESEGLVEVWARGAWGAICSGHWDDAAATVVCHQLQPGRKGVAKHTPFSGLGPVPVHWGDVRCRGDEENILLCRKDVWRGGPCPPELAAAVRCSLAPGPASPVLRLAGGSSKREGRVELFHSGQWGTVCDNQWDDADAEVVCRQLGLSGVARAWTQAHFGAGAGPVLLGEVHCTGNELSVEQCPRSPWGEHNCGHGEDAGVSCTPLTDGALRLAGGRGRHEGRLEVYHGGQWGTVCDDGWTVLSTEVACRQLGFKYGKQASADAFEESRGPIWLDDVSCSGQEPSLLRCPRSPWGQHDCSHQEDVAVACSPGGHGHRPPLGFPIRLRDGENKKEGRVEVFIGGQWGTVCDDGWTDEDAAVACRQLGYRGPAKARSLAYFGEGGGPIHLDNVGCTGAEGSLADCVKQDVGRHNCRHSEDAGVICDYFDRKAPGNSDKAFLPSVCGLRPLRRRQKRIVGGKNSLRCFPLLSCPLRMHMGGFLPSQGRLAMAGITAAQVASGRRPAPVWGHAPEQLLGADSRTLLQEVREQHAELRRPARGLSHSGARGVRGRVGGAADRPALGIPARQQRLRHRPGQTPGPAGAVRQAQQPRPASLPSALEGEAPEDSPPLLHHRLGRHRAGLFQNSAASSHPPPAQEDLRGALQGQVYGAHALCWEPPGTQPRGQLPGRQRRTPHVREAGSQLGGVWGHLLGIWLPRPGFTRRVHQSFSLRTLDKKCHPTVTHGNLKGKQYLKNLVEIFSLHIGTQPEVPADGDRGPCLWFGLKTVCPSAAQDNVRQTGGCETPRCSADGPH